ncbi:MAG: shikimate dehydrogenase [Candidatus Ferrigenium altingense]
MIDRYAVIGNPIAHSKSPLIHGMFAAQTGQDISYEAILAPLDGFAATVERLRKEGYKGCNVTVPFKFEAYELVRELAERTPPAGAPTQRATNARAANTLKFHENFIDGDNTDGTGLVRNIERILGVSLHGKRILLIGAGGAAYGVALPLLLAEAHLFIANRTPEKADQFALHLGKLGHVVNVYNFPNEADRKQFDLIINATSAGLSNELPPLPADIFAPGALAYDMMYGRETPFMRFAREHGAQVADGLGMLVEQAAEAFYIWRGVRPDTAPIIAALRT